MIRFLFIIICVFATCQAFALKAEQSLLADSIVVSDTVAVVDTIEVVEKVKIPEMDLESLINEIDIYFNYFDEALPENERFPNKVEAYLIVNGKIKYNGYRLLYRIPQTKVNPFIYDAVPYKPEPYAAIELEDDSLAEVLALYGDTIHINLKDNFSAAYNAINTIAITRPDLMTISWNQLPDPPKISDDHYLPLINDIQFEMEPFEDPFKDFKIEGITKKPNYWRFYGKSILQMAQRQITYWAKGGVSSFTLLGIFNYDAIYQKDKLKWENDVELKLGMIQSDEKGTEKSDDNFTLGSKLGFRAVNNWFYTLNLDIKTQFINKNRNDADDFGFLSPADLKLAMGMEYKKKSNFSLLISPLTANFTFVVDTNLVSPLRYGIPKGKKMKSEIGGYIKGTVKKRFSEDYFWTSKLYIFSNYDGFPDNTDVDWENILELKVNHFVSARISCQLKYDYDYLFEVGIDDNGEKIKETRWQFSELLSLGLSYVF